MDPKQYTLIHSERLLSHPQTTQALLNTLKVGIVTAIDVIAIVPVAIPGLVIGVAYLWAWIGLPGSLYGTIWILAPTFVARVIPDTVLLCMLCDDGDSIRNRIAIEVLQATGRYKCRFFYQRVCWTALGLAS